MLFSDNSSWVTLVTPFWKDQETCNPVIGFDELLIHGFILLNLIHQKHWILNLSISISNHPKMICLNATSRLYILSIAHRRSKRLHCFYLHHLNMCIRSGKTNPLGDY